MDTVAVPTKVCTRCLNEWTLDAFSPDGYTRDGLHGWCKPCINEKVKERHQQLREQDPEGFKARQREATRAHRERTGNAAGKQYNRAYRKAVRRLIDTHEDEFNEYLSEALEAERQAS